MKNDPTVLQKAKYMDNVISYSNRHDSMVSLKPNPKGPKLV